VKDITQINLHLNREDRTWQWVLNKDEIAANSKMANWNIPSAGWTQTPSNTKEPFSVVTLTPNPTQSF